VLSTAQPSLRLKAYYSFILKMSKY